MSTTTKQIPYKPAQRSCYAVWEITLKCNLACNHCGSRAGDARVNELSTAEALDLVHQMADIGITEVTLIGGEAFLRKDWLEIAEEINRCGMICSMTTGGYGISRTIAERMKQAGINQVSISVDGMKHTHDRLRGTIGSWTYAFKSMQHLNAVGIPFGANTQVNRHSAPEFPRLYEALVDAGAKAWQIQMTVPMGNAADNSDLLLQPDELLIFHPVLAYLARKGYERGFYVQPGNNFGYYGPYERLLRGMGQEKEWMFWNGCNAGLSTLGIEADGTIKGCPSLPTAAYTGGNIREKSLIDIVTGSEELTFNLKAGTDQGTEHLWGFCKSCDYAALCRGACNWTAHVFFDRRGNNPYCHHRSLVNAARGIRERFAICRKPSGLPFDNGVFDLYSEAFDADFTADDNDPLRLTPDKIQWPESWLKADPGLKDYVQQEIRNNLACLQNSAIAA
ncbi:MAG: heme biosynthesis protein [Thiothrix nivea]|nr:MAG: heme biosynthesis protein [Thiothrix nivea]